VNILNKQSRTAESDGTSAWVLREVLTTPHRKTVTCYDVISYIPEIFHPSYAHISFLRIHGHSYFNQPFTKFD